jgi:hypothetical protein
VDYATTVQEVRPAMIFGDMRVAPGEASARSAIS